MIIPLTDYPYTRRACPTRRDHVSGNRANEVSICSISSVPRARDDRALSVERRQKALGSLSDLG